MEKVNEYEAMVVLNARPTDEQIKDRFENFLNLIRSNGELTEDVEDMGRRRLAYDIEDEKEGYYFLVRFKANPSFPKEFERQLRIDDQILRFLVIRTDDQKD